MTIPTGHRIRFADGSSAARIIDLSNDHPHPYAPGRLAVCHGPDDVNATSPGRMWFRFFGPGDLVPADLHCRDCAPSVVTRLTGTPDCVAAGFYVQHQESCPVLRRMLRARP